MSGESPLEAEMPAAAIAPGERAPALAPESASQLRLRVANQRVLHHLSNGIGSRLPDGGGRMRGLLEPILADIDRRAAKEVGACNRFTQPEDRKSPVEVKDCLQSGAVKDSGEISFASKSLEKLEGQAGSTCNDALCEVSQGRNKGCRENEGNDLERKYQIATSSQSYRVFSKQTPFRSVSSFTMKANRRYINGDRSIESGTKKRRTATSDGKKSLARMFEKAREVVLFDDVVHSGDSTGDDSDKLKVMKIYYPSRDDPESVELIFSDIKCLDPESLLSSPIMNFYIQYLQADKRRGDYHIFNTYFYKKLEEAVSPRADKSCFKKLRRWWKDINIFQKSYIFIPVHGNLHWSLVVICLSTKDDESGSDVLHLDSLGIHDNHSIFNVIDRYLKLERDYIKTQISLCPDILISEKILERLLQRINKKSITVPQQKNAYDCGVFVLYFMERFIEEAPVGLRQNDLATLGSKWFRAEDASGLRKKIKYLLLEVFRHAKQSKIEGDKAESTYSDNTSDDYC